jgi:PKD repeat protein
LYNTKSPGGQAVELAFVNESSYAVGYKWDLGDGSESEEVSPIHTYSSGTYTVTLTAFGITGDASNSVFSETITIN